MAQHRLNESVKDTLMRLAHYIVDIDGILVSGRHECQDCELRSADI